ncbi:MAG: hypothetical protein R6V45_04800 [Oceanipulchritudo sp.]
MENTTTKTKASNSESLKDSREQLVEDLKRAIEDAQNLADEAKNASGAAIHEKIEAVQKDLGNRVKALRKTGDSVINEVEEQAGNFEDLIGRYPWRSIAVAALAGVLADRILFR